MVAATSAVVQAAPSILFDTPMAVRECLLAGGGLGRIHRYIVAGDLAAGRLRTILPGWRCPGWTMSMLKTARASTRLAEAFLAACEKEVRQVPGLVAPDHPETATSAAS